MLCRLVYSPDLQRHFLNRVSLLPDDSNVCWVDIKFASTTGEMAQQVRHLTSCLNPCEKNQFLQAVLWMHTRTWAHTYTRTCTHANLNEKENGTKTRDSGICQGWDNEIANSRLAWTVYWNWPYLYKTMTNKASLAMDSVSLMDLSPGSFKS